MNSRIHCSALFSDLSPRGQAIFAALHPLRKVKRDLEPVQSVTIHFSLYLCFAAPDNFLMKITALIRTHSRNSRYNESGKLLILSNNSGDKSNSTYIFDKLENKLQNWTTNQRPNDTFATEEVRGPNLSNGYPTTE